MKRIIILTLICVTLLPAIASAQRRRRSSAKRSAPVAKAPAISPAEIQAGRQQVAAQIKVLTQFLYLLGGITKGIESADLSARNREASTAAIEQNERNKTKVKDSLRNVRAGLDKLETDFHSNPKLASYYTSIAGVARIGETAENQAAANRFDEAGRSLVKAVNQLADALAAMR